MSTRPDDLDRLLRDTVAARGRELVPDSATPPPLDLDRPVASSAASPRPRTTPRPRPAWWLTTGLAAAAAALLVVGTTVLHAAQTGAERPAGPTPPGVTVTTTTTPAPTSTPSPSSTTWTADPRPYTQPVGPSEATVVPPPATTAPATTPVPPTTTAPAVAVGVYADCNQPPQNDPWVQRPSFISLACADAGEIIGDIQWTSWGATSAVGQATVILKNCVPSCTQSGTPYRVPTTVTLGGVRPDAQGRPVFTTARLSPPPRAGGQSYPADYQLFAHP